MTEEYLTVPPTQPTDSEVQEPNQPSPSRADRILALCSLEIGLRESISLTI